MPETIQQYFALAAVIISVGSHVYFWLTKGSRGNEKHLKEADDKLEDHEKRLSGLENEFKHLPTREGQHELAMTMEKMNGNLREMSATMTAMGKTVSRMESEMMSGGGS